MPKDVCKCSIQRGYETVTWSPHAAATMARVRKWTARCPAVGISSPTVVLLVFWVLVRVSVFCSILTWNVPNLLCQAETLWS